MTMSSNGVPPLISLAVYLAYVSLLALLLSVILVIVKFLGVFDEDVHRINEEEDVGPTETNPLSSAKTVAAVTYYGACGEDLETGNCNNSNISTSSSCSSEDLYDKKLCVICYDEQRSCFFVPCGHCATCYVCALRIFYGENKTCPVCRRLIGKVRKLFAA